MDKLVQDKQDSMEEATITAIPIVTTIVPFNLGALVATTTPVATTLPIASTTTSTIVATHPSDESSKLIKSMEDMSTQTNEVNRLKEQIKSIEDEKKLDQIMHKNETQKSNRLNERIQKLEKELTLKEPLAQAKQLLWTNIIDSVNDIWPSIQLIFEQNDWSKRLVRQFKGLEPNLAISQKKPQE